MSSDENESKPPGPNASLNTSPSASPSARSGRALALIPITVAVLMFLLMMPRSAPPEDIPLPQVDGVAMRALVKDDAARAAEARTNRLPGDILAIGTAVRALNKAQAVGDAEATGAGRLVLDDALRGVGNREEKVVFDQLKTLRAVQLEEFLAAVESFESTGQQTPDLVELGGGFIERMTDAGWVEGRRVLLDDAGRRAAFKLVWTTLLRVDRTPQLALALDEQRALYTLYLTHPHPPESQRSSFQAMRRVASNDAECASVASKERLAAEVWRSDKIRKLGELDPSYPTAYALGVSYYRAGRYDQSLSAFRTWLDQHPDGPLALRARNHLKAALVANGPS